MPGTVAEIHTAELAAAETGRWQAAWELAAAPHPGATSISFYRFAEVTVRTRIVGEELAAAVGRAFRNCGAAATAHPELRIDLWDEKAAGVPRPAKAPSSSDDRDVRVGSTAVSIRHGGRVFSTARGPDSTTWLDRATSTLIGWRREAARMPFVEFSKPLSMPLRVWYYDRDIDVVHACLVARDGAGVLVGGVSGAGKSTTALACRAAGFDFVGDDEIGLSVSARGGPCGYGLYDTMRIRAGAEMSFADRDDLLPARRDPQTGKGLYFLSELSPRPIPAAATIRAAVFPRIVDGLACRIRPIAPREAALRLGGESVFGPLGMGERAFVRSTQLFATVPAYEIELGRDWQAAASCIDGILARADR